MSDEIIALKGIVKGVAGFIGSVSMYALWSPDQFKDLKPFIAGLLFGWIGFFTAFFTTGAVMNYFGIPVQSDNETATGWIIGVGSVLFLNLIATTAVKWSRSNKGITDIIRDHRNSNDD